MIQSGKIKKYDQDRGFGFIQNDQGQDIFFHIKDFPKGVLPQVGERLTFAITQDKKSNKNKAVNITRLDYPDVQQASGMHQPERIISRPRQRATRGEPTTSLFTWLLSIIVVISGGIFAYNFVQKSIHRHDLANQSVDEETLAIANIQAGTGSNNVIPGELFVQFNFRFSTELTDEMIKAQVLALLEKHQLRYTVDWWLSGQPFLTARGKLVDAVVNAVEHYNEIKPQLLTTGGTSDGRFIARMGAQVVELGPVNATIHKINECVNAADLQLLARMYQRIMEQLVA